MTDITVIGDPLGNADGSDGADFARNARGSRSDERLYIDAGELEAATGWRLEDRGLCRGDVCVPVGDRERLASDEKVDLVAFGHALGLPVVVDAEEGVVAFGTPARARAAALDSLQAPAFTLPDLTGRPRALLSEFAGVKKLFLAWASW